MIRFSINISSLSVDDCEFVRDLSLIGVCGKGIKCDDDDDDNGTMI